MNKRKIKNAFKHFNDLTIDLAKKGLYVLKVYSDGVYIATSFINSIYSCLNNKNNKDENLNKIKLDVFSSKDKTMVKGIILYKYDDYYDLESESVSGNINEWRSFNIEFDFKNQKIVNVRKNCPEYLDYLFESISLNSLISFNGSIIKEDESLVGLVDFNSLWSNDLAYSIQQNEDQVYLRIRMKLNILSKIYLIDMFDVGCESFIFDWDSLRYWGARADDGPFIYFEK